MRFTFLIVLFVGTLIAAATAAAIGKRQSSACDAADIAELNSILGRVQSCRASIQCQQNESMCECCSRLGANGGACCDEYASGIALYRQCRNSGALNDMRRQVNINFSLFNNCGFSFSPNRGAATSVLTTEVVALCAALLASTKLFL